MNIYLISQVENDNYDTFDAAVVAAESEDAARLIHPETSWGHVGVDWDRPHGSWCNSPDKVAVKLIGVAAEGTAAGVILASFNAG